MSDDRIDLLRARAFLSGWQLGRSQGQLNERYPNHPEGGARDNVEAVFEDWAVHNRKTIHKPDGSCVIHEPDEETNTSLILAMELAIKEKEPPIL